MSQTVTGPGTATSRSPTEWLSVRSKLAAGIIAGPLFAVVAGAQIATRDGFDLTVHPISQLSTGRHGWIQIANFVVTGCLVLLAAGGIRHTLATGRGSRWIPRLVAVFGIGLIASGVFVADPENGFPPGTPAGPADGMSWHAIAHAASAAISLDGLTIAMIVLAVRLFGQRRFGVAAVNLGAALSMIALGSQPMSDGISIRIALTAVVAFAWVSALTWKLRQDTRGTR